MRQKEQLPEEGSYQLLAISQAEGEILEYEGVLKRSIPDEIISAQEGIVSTVELLKDLCLPEETVNRFRESAQSMSLDKLADSITAYHIARDFKDLPYGPLADREKDIDLAVRLAKGLKISGPEILRTILTETPPGRMEQLLYRYSQNGTVTWEEAKEIAQEFYIR